MRTKYLVIIEKGDKGTYGAYSPDLPGCVAIGDTVEETERLMDEAIELYLEERGSGWHESAPLYDSSKLFHNHSLIEPREPGHAGITTGASAGPATARVEDPLRRACVSASRSRSGAAGSRRRPAPWRS